MSQVSNMGKHAMAYLKRGWAVIPLWWVDKNGYCACALGQECSSKGKHPHTIGTTKPITTLIDAQLYWYHNPLCNIGLATGKISNMVVLDIDPRHDGLKSAKKIWEKHGKPPKTAISKTGGGGWHLLFDHPGGVIKNSVSFRPGLDIRADGGLIVAPPSNHESGNNYQWVEKYHPKIIKKLAPIPLWIMMLNNRGNKNNYRKGKFRGSPDPNTVPSISEGARNNTLTSYVGRWIRDGYHENELSKMATIANSRFDPPLPKKEVDYLVKTAFSRWTNAR